MGFDNYIDLITSLLDYITSSCNIISCGPQQIVILKSVKRFKNHCHRRFCLSLTRMTKIKMNGQISRILRTKLRKPLIRSHNCLDIFTGQGTEGKIKFRKNPFPPQVQKTAVGYRWGKSQAPILNLSFLLLSITANKSFREFDLNP